MIPFNREKLCPTFSVNDLHFPHGLCITCHSWLDRLKSGTCKSLHFVSEHLGDTVLPHVTRGSKANQECPCVICYRAKINGLQWIKFRAEAKAKQKSNGKVNGPMISRKLCPICLSKVWYDIKWLKGYLANFYFLIEESSSF